MKLIEYQQKALNTAVYQNSLQAKMCCRLGLLGEIGEVCELFKKDLRGDNDALFRTKLVYELGDIMWYSVSFCHYHDIDLPQHSFILTQDKDNDSGEQEQNYLNHYSLEEKIALYDRISLKLSLLGQSFLDLQPNFTLFFDEILPLLQLDIAYILTQNINKLAKRYQQKKLHGSGSLR